MNPPAWALAWFVTTFVITKNVKEHFAVFGASGALVFALVTWLVLTFLVRANERKAQRYLNIDRAVTSPVTRQEASGEPK